MVYCFFYNMCKYNYILIFSVNLSIIFPNCARLQRNNNRPDSATLEFNSHLYKERRPNRSASCREILFFRTFVPSKKTDHEKNRFNLADCSFHLQFIRNVSNQNRT